ncbi:MAG TPA: hypothetical protein VJI96_04295 [Candidatus Andersenbacteria bacterium]|nr:hypothetical protein [Candidatus Andersenbacteria bacterium]
MIMLKDLRELLYTVMLIAGFCITGFFAQSGDTLSPSSVSVAIEEAPHGVPLIANPVVQIEVPEHNIFAP